jgi:hypothetical protein
VPAINVSGRKEMPVDLQPGVPTPEGENAFKIEWLSAAGRNRPLQAGTDGMD